MVNLDDLKRLYGNAAYDASTDFPEQTCARCGQPVDVRGDWDNGEDWCYTCCDAFARRVRTALPELIAEVERLRRLLPDPRTLSGWEDEHVPPDVAVRLIELAEAVGVDVPQRLRDAIDGLKALREAAEAARRET